MFKKIIYCIVFANVAFIFFLLHYALNHCDAVETSSDALFLPEYERSINATTKCLDFGSAVEGVKGISFSRGAVTESFAEGEVNYRAIKAGECLYFEIDAFNTDSKGLPLSPMLLQIRYKDTIDQSLGSGKNITNHRAIISSRIDYLSKDRIRFHDLTFLGADADHKWKYMQYGFGKTPFPLLRSVNGKFIFKICMPTSHRVDKTLTLPVDYILLKVISDDEYDALFEKQKKANGFYNVDLSADESTKPVSYPDPNFVIFVRDPMRPVYQHTKPKLSELIDTVQIFSASGEVEPSAFSIYSKGGLDISEIKVSDLVNKKNQNRIKEKKITVQKVVCAPKRLTHYYAGENSKSSALIPDYLKEVSSLSVSADTSERIWLHIDIPDSTPAGLYEGNIILKTKDRTQNTLQLHLKILPVKLQPPMHMSLVYHDPYSIRFSDYFDATIKAYSQTGFDPIINTAIHIEPVVKNNLILDYDTTKFESRLVFMKKKGVIRKYAMIDLGVQWTILFRIVYGKNAASRQDPFFYEKLTDKKFAQPFSLLVKKILNIAKEQELTFLFSVRDEPGKEPYTRIATDRLYTLIKELGGKTTVTYDPRCDEEISSGTFRTPTGKIPPLTKLVDYKVWNARYQGAAYEQDKTNYGYYTTPTSYLRNPVYNRFLHGLLAFRTEAKVVSSYAFLTPINDPFNDFDGHPLYIRPFTKPDFLLAYPTWSNQMLPTLALEGLREGIKDAKYIATLKKLIEIYPNEPAAREARQYIEKIKQRIDPDYWNAYPGRATSRGYDHLIMKHLSRADDPGDYEAFTEIRKKIFDYISLLATENVF